MKLLDTLSDDLTRFAMREMLAHLVRLERQAVLRSSHDPVARWYPASDLVTAPSGIDEGARHSRHRGPRLTSQRSDAKSPLTSRRVGTWPAETWRTSRKKVECPTANKQSGPFRVFG